MANINLLPSDLGPKASVTKLAGALKRITIGGLIIFCFIVFLAIGYLIYLDLESRKVAANNESLQKSIKSLEKTEQKLFLIKNRLSLIKGLKNEQALTSELDGLTQILGGPDNGLAITRVETTVGFIKTFGTSSTLQGFENFLEEVLVNPDYKTVTLKSLSFNQISGISFELEILTK